jgi:hypothetical protein
MEKTMQTSLRNKNAGRTEIDYDLNIFMREEEDPRTGEWYYDPTSWMIHVYEVDDHGHHEVHEARALTIEEIRSLGLNNDEYFEGGDAWYGMSGYLKEYWDVLPDSIKQYLESFPKYKD